jgi:catechol 2,3-dioxygenase-like lactoylglutathione lyase family enzyme
MPKITGVGGIFFKSDDPEKLYAWYEKNLGFVRKDGGVTFRWRDGRDAEALTIWSIFPKQSEYFSPSVSSFMINYRVDDLDGLLDELRAKGVEIDPKREDHEYGRFAWLTDPDGNKIELWQPPR